ncbi:MAG TPA: hypothetical protein VHV29_11270 [Terriglobales bacterium]|nr:hypothetical protein [Terriglobales bacterium]
MSSFAIRGGMVPLGQRVRAYFAPVNRATETPAVFDPGRNAGFSLDSPPAPWIDLGWIDNFQRVSLTPSEPLRAGIRGAAAAQFRGILDARIEFDFREWGKLQMALAGGSEHMNVLASDPSSPTQPSGGSPLAATAVLPGSSAGEVIVGAGPAALFSVDDIIAVDADYQQQTGYVGSGISAAYVNNPPDVNQDVNYIRRVTFNLGRVAQLNATSLLLAQPLLGGTPVTGAGVQKVLAFVDREGGAFFQEWSALFVTGDASGGRICFYYPRLSPATTVHPTTSAAPPVFMREQTIVVGQPTAAITLHAAFIALPHTDENDGQIAVCYRSYFPAAMSALY